MPIASHLYDVFLAAVEHGTITEAARVLGLPRPTASRQLAQLEEQLGVALLHRTTRRVAPTAAGQRLVERLRPLFDAWAAAEAEARELGHEVQGAVRVSVLPLLCPAMTPVLVALRAEHPRLAVELVSQVHLPDLRHDRFDAAIWAGEPRDGDLVARSLAYGRVGLVASPAYLAAHGAPTSPADLASHTLLRGHSLGGRPRTHWPLLDGGTVRVGGTFVSNDARLLSEATVAGLGICLLSDLTARHGLADGTLVRVLPEAVGRTATVRLIMAPWSPIPARLRVFADAVATHFGPTNAARPTVGSLAVDPEPA